MESLLVGLKVKFWIEYFGQQWCVENVKKRGDFAGFKLGK